MSEEANLAAEYRRHARALREAAAFDRNAVSSITLGEIAEEYDQMAVALEGINRTHQNMRRRRKGTKKEASAKPGLDGPEKL